MRVIKFLILFLSICTLSVCAFKPAKNSVIKSTKDRVNRRLQQPIEMIASAGPVPVAPVQIVAKVLGYIMGIGSMTVYTPILLKLAQTKDTAGLSVQTWIFNVIGLSLAASYPYQRGFPISSYIELIILSIQSFIILGTICIMNKDFTQFLQGLLPLSAFIGAITCFKFPSNILQSVQIISALICNYANIPQIYLSYTTKKSGWSRTTAAMSVGGNLIRVYTTIKLTKDPFFLFGFLLGAITNGILLYQTFIYPSK